MYIETCNPELINLSACLSVSYEDSVHDGQSGIFARYGEEYIPVLTEQYLRDIMGDNAIPEYSIIANLLENAVPVINRLLIEPNRTFISHYDILKPLEGKSLSIENNSLQGILTMLSNSYLRQ